MKQTRVLPVPGKPTTLKKYILYSLLLLVTFLLLFFGFKAWQAPAQFSSTQSGNTNGLKDSSQQEAAETMTDSALLQVYGDKMKQIINGDTSGRWSIKPELPLPGSILPYKRIIAYYGNLYSKQMGILGEFPVKEMLQKLNTQIQEWKTADSTLEIQPALHYIAVTAQSLPGKGGKYRLRMPFHQIDSVLRMASLINAIVFLDIQVGLSNLQAEVPELEKYLALPNVHLGIDPEFSMKGGQKPGAVVGTFDAEDINYTTTYLDGLVKKYNLPPKILVVHRFTQGMVTGYKKIKTQPTVQIVMHMDGWGEPARKINTYKQFIYREPVEYTGFKLFYKNDTKNKGRLLTPGELLKLKPQPVYIQYQ